MSFAVCPGCDGEPLALSVDGVKTCSACGGVFGEVSLSTYRCIVKQEWSKQDNFDNAKYFHFFVKEYGRSFHGWIDPDGYLLQTG